MVLKFFSFLRSHSFRELSWAPGEQQRIKLLYFNTYSKKVTKTKSGHFSAKSKAAAHVGFEFSLHAVCKCLIFVTCKSANWREAFAYQHWAAVLLKNTVSCSDLWPDSIHSQRRQWRWRAQSGLGSWPRWCAPSNPRSWFENQRFQFQKWDHQGGTVHRWELQREEEHITTWDRTIVTQDADQRSGHKGSYRSQHFHQWLWWGLCQSGCQKMPSTAEEWRNKREVGFTT